MSLRRRTLIAAVGLAPAILRRARAADPVAVRIGFASIGVGNRQFTGGNAVATAHAERYLEQEFAGDPEVRIEWSFFRGAGPAVNEALANNQLDFAQHGDLPAMIGRGNGLKTKIVLAAGANTPTYLGVPANSAIHGIDDLRGKRVALFFGTNLQLAIDRVLSGHNLTERDIKLINMDFAASDAALATGNIDAAFGAFDLFPLADEGIARIAYSTKGDNPGYARHAHLHVTEAFEQAHPDLTARIVKACVKAAKWSSLEENRAALFAIWARSGYPESSFAFDCSGQTLKFRNTVLLDEFLIDQYRLKAEQARAFRLLKHDVDIPGWFEPRYLSAALKELQLENFWVRRDRDGHDLPA